MTEDTRKHVLEVKRLASSGILLNDIAKYLQISKDELLTDYSDILNTAAVDKTMLVASALFDLATVDGNLQAQIFWLKNIGKWEKLSEQEEETIQKTEILTDINIKVGVTKEDFENKDEV